MGNKDLAEVLPAFDYSCIKNADVRAKVMHLREQVMVSKNRIGTEFIKICRIVSDVHGLFADSRGVFEAWAASMGWSKRYAQAMVRASDRLSNIDDKTLERFSYTAIIAIANSAPDAEVLGECVARAERGLTITAGTITEVSQQKSPKPTPRTRQAAASTTTAPPQIPTPEQPVTPEPPKSAASPPTDETGQDDAESGSDKENRKEPAAGVSITTPPQPPPATAPLHTENVTARDVASMTVSQKIELDNGELELFCRKLLKCFDDNLPDNPWLIDKGRAASARASVGAACATIRSAKQVCCPACCPQGDVEPDENCDWCRGHGGLPKSLAETIHL